MHLLLLLLLMIVLHPTSMDDDDDPKKQTIRLVGDHRLFKSEIKTLEKAAQTISVLQRKEFLRKEIPRMAEEIATLNAALTKMMANGGDQLDPSGKYHKMAEKLLLQI